MLNIVYPVAAEMFEIQQDLVKADIQDRLVFKLFPIRPSSTFDVRWIQQDNTYGVMNFRGLGGAPPRVKRLGSSTFAYAPGVYGEHTMIDEGEYLRRADPKNPTTPIDVSDLVGADQKFLVGRRLDRMELSAWTLALTGTISIQAAGPLGPVVSTDSYTIQTYTAPIPWSSTSTATPLANMQTVQQLSVGHSGSFGPDAVQVMNRVQANRLLNNSNTADFGGRRNQFGATINDIMGFNNYFRNQGLARVEVNDEGFQTQPVAGPITNINTQYQKFIPNGSLAIVGKRPGNAPVGTWRMCINAEVPDRGAAPYSFVKDYFRGIMAPKETPGRLEVHDGFNGGLTIEYPTAVVGATMG